MQPLISVIIPVYNVEEYLPRCVDSILAQTYQNMEIILVDDGSPDNCPAICDRYARKDSRIVALHKTNGGPSSARNMGLDHAHGKFISFVDSDDYVSPLFLERLYQRISSDKTDIAVCEFQEVGDPALFSTSKGAIPFEGVIDAETFMRWELSGCYMFCIIACNKLYRAELWEQLRYPLGKYSEDNFAFNEYIQIIQRVSVMKEPLYYYLQRSNSLIHDYGVKNLDSTEARLNRSAYYLSIGCSELARKTLQNVSAPLLYAHENLDLSNPFEARRYSELRSYYLRLYRQAGCRVGLSEKAIGSAVYAHSERMAVLLYKTRKAVRKAFHP